MASKKCAAAGHNHCVACGTCVAVCPRGAIQIVRGCYALVESELCVGCGKCGEVCPTGCITLVERGAAG